MEDVWSTLKRQKYKIVGAHSAVKICHWTKKSLIENRVCYKQKFYGIESHRCLQMTPSVAWCTHKCLFCWRPVEYNEDTPYSYDVPEAIVEGCINAQRELLSGYHGFLEKVDINKLKEAENPTNVAISLAGEPTLYPDLSGLIEEFRKRKFSTFLVTNGTTPDVFCCNYTPNVCSIKIEGVFIFDGSDKEGLINEWKEKKRLDTDKFLFIHNSILYRCFVEAVGVSKDINVPSPVSIPTVSVKKEVEPGEGLVYG
ncbi:MAG: S-adenosyl-L-methionine-dependent tRNA 4-demethylwyosine synthase [Candidatus Methanofastidiosum methylothiophilum]|uniref:S-adenosyl-L-methionine-dependent tRNA 4-demethylwyosine synthase n=1 Tax=Candidatus Methanofastidiosum methylothiophilum TaxID=1705564 RepID=A0A150JBM6_9EURY|nr:MAG: S-adenosyl-L-methionine-dependent tRNA 4-demethylwyosine synthase [Candidatus Methanofastidiosum methylthiophilus]